jgi:ATP-binding cassette, subfamily C, bacterial
MLIRHLRARRADVGWLAFWSLVQGLPTAASGWALAEATGQFLAGHAAAGLSWLGLQALAAVAGAIGVRQAYLRAGAIVEPLRDDLVAAAVDGALAEPAAPGGPASGARSVARLTHQAEIVRDSLGGLLIVAGSFAFTVASALAGLVTLAPATLPYVAAPALTSMALLRLLVRPAIARHRAMLAAEEEVAQDTARAVSGVRDITACGAEDQVLAGLTAAIARQAAAARATAALGSARVVCLAAGGWLPLLLVLAAAPSMLGHGTPPGAVVGAVAYIMGAMRGALQAASQGLGTGLVRLQVTMDRIRQAAPAAPAAPPGGGLPNEEDSSKIARAAGPSRQARAPSGPAGRLTLRDVRFGYGPLAVPVIDGLTADIPPGDHLAVVGPSGAGKSSLAGLLAGLLTPTRGEVLLDGIPAARRGPGCRVLIPQEAYVFEGTLADNIGYLRPAGLAELDAAAEAVGLTVMLPRLGGYDAPVSPATLSAGERQLIALTRAYLSPAPVAILDEATCHLDPAAEQRAEAAFARRGGTLIIVAHRITSALRANRILVLDGLAARAGTHDELMGCCAMYRDLVGYWSAAAPERNVPSPRGHLPPARRQQPR